MRLNHPAIHATGKPVTIRFEGRPIQALQGETIAAALSAADIVAFRRTSSGAPRGLHCGMGACWDCIVTVDGLGQQRACMTPVADGMQISGDLPQHPVPLPCLTPLAEQPCDVLVVGGGVAGLSAAIAAAEAGADVVLLDERRLPGGQFAKQLAASHRHTEPDAQFRLGAVQVQQAVRAGVRIETDAIAWGAFAPDEIAALVGGRAVTFRPRRLILAPGAHEAPVPVPGWTLPGVMTTGALQTLVRTQRVCPGRRVVIAGNGPLNFQLACELLAAGAKPVAVVEAAARPAMKDLRAVWRMARTAPDLTWNGLAMLMALKREGVPVLWQRQVARLEGTDRVRMVELSDTSIEADLVAMNSGFQPETGLARALGLPHRFVASPTVLWPAPMDMGTSQPKPKRTAGPPMQCSWWGTERARVAPGLPWREDGSPGSRRRVISALRRPMEPGRAGYCAGRCRSRRRCGACSNRLWKARRPCRTTFPWRTTLLCADARR